MPSVGLSGQEARGSGRRILGTAKMCTPSRLINIFYKKNTFSIVMVSNILRLEIVFHF